MKNRKLVRPVFRLTAAALAVSLMFGCGGSSDTSPASSGQPAPVSAPAVAAQSVSVVETATTMSVMADVRTAGKPMLYEAQSSLYSFAARIDAGPNKGVALTGLLTLKGEREDEGYTEVEGRLFPDESPTLPPPAEDLKAKFEADRKELKAALRADIKALSADLRLALANGAVPDSSGLSAAQREALALFRS